MKKNVVLLGMKAVWKSTIAKIAAKRGKLKFIDTDSNIQKKNLMTISEIFEKKGETFFRNEEEKEVLKSLKKSNSIIALGGGAFINENLRKSILKTSISIWMDINLETLAKRIQNNTRRPLLDKENNLEKLKAIFVKRKKFYKLANYRIKCDNLSKVNIAKKIVDIYEQQ